MKAIVKTRDLVRVIKNVRKFIGTNGNMQYIKFEVKETELRAMAIDGYSFSIEQCECTADESFEFYYRPFVPVMKDGEYTEIEMVNDKVLVTTGENIKGFVQPDIGQFYNLDEGIENNTKKDVLLRIGFNPDLLKKAIDIERVDKLKPIVLEFRGPKEVLVIRNGEKNIKVVLPCTIHDEYKGE